MTYTPIRRRCLQFIQALQRSGYRNEIPLETAKIMFSRELGLFDRATMKAYFGSQPGRTVRKIQRLAQYGSGTYSYKTIELAQDIPHRKGYLETLGLATIERKAHTWFLRISECSIVPVLGFHTYERYESKKSMTEISLSHLIPLSLKGRVRKGTDLRRFPYT